MRNLYIIILLLVSFFGYTQEAPTGYKFTSVIDMVEFPSAGHTGILDAQIPLYSVDNNGFKLPIALTYDQMGNTNVLYQSNQFGDAWVLNVAGTISRKSEKQLPVITLGKVGFDCRIMMGTLVKTKNIKEMPYISDEFFFSDPANSRIAHRDKSDIFTFSFLELSGRFKIYRDAVTQKLNAEVLESNDFVAIEIITPQAYELIGTINIYDKQGNKYQFSSPSNVNKNETTDMTYLAEDVLYSDTCQYQKGSNINKTHVTLVMAPGSSASTNTAKEGSIVNGLIERNGHAFWENLEITNIFDKDGNHLINFEYEQVNVMVTDVSTTWINTFGLARNFTKLLIKNINIIGKGTIEFKNSIAPFGTRSLVNSFTKSIEIKNLKNEKLQKLDFNYKTIGPIGFRYAYLSLFSENPYDKRFLNEVIKSSGNNNINELVEEKTKIKYKELYPFDNSFVDSYGFVSNLDFCIDHSKLSSYKANANILQSIVYPTGGSVVYKFEPNTYTEGKVLGMDRRFEESNFDNKIFQRKRVQLLSGSSDVYYLDVNEGDTLVIFNPNAATLNIYKQPNNFTDSNVFKRIRQTRDDGRAVEWDQCLHHGDLLVIPTGSAINTLYFKFAGYPNNINNVRINKRTTKTTDLKNYNYASGNRIAKIAYFETEVYQSILETGAGDQTATKVISYDYSGEHLPNSSSGKVISNYRLAHLRPSILIYGKVGVNIRGIGKQEVYYNLPHYDYWDETGTRTDIIETKTYNLANRLISETKYDYTFKKRLYNDSWYIQDKVKPYIKTTNILSKEYENNVFLKTMRFTEIGDDYFQPIKEETIFSDSKAIKNTYTYVPSNKKIALTSHNEYINSALAKESKMTYDSSGNLTSTSFKLPEMPTFETVGMTNLIYRSGKLVGYTQPDGIKVAMIYGYNGSQVVAKLINIDPTVFYGSNINYILVNIENASDQLRLNAGDLKTALASLYSTYPNALITTYMYSPMIGINTITDENQKNTTYLYDSFGRLSTIKDHDGNIVKKYSYNIANQ